MKERIRHAFANHPVLSALFLFMLAAFVALAIRVAFAAFIWFGPSPDTSNIEGWMTPGLVAKRWDIPRDVMVGLVGEGPAPDRRRRTLQDIADEQGIPLEELISRIETGIAALHSDAAPK